MYIVQLWCGYLWQGHMRIGAMEYLQRIRKYCYSTSNGIESWTWPTMSQPLSKPPPLKKSHPNGTRGSPQSHPKVPNGTPEDGAWAPQFPPTWVLDNCCCWGTQIRRFMVPKGINHSSSGVYRAVGHPSKPEGTAKTPQGNKRDNTYMPYGLGEWPDEL